MPIADAGESDVRRGATDEEGTMRMILARSLTGSSSRFVTATLLVALAVSTADA